MLRKLTKKWVRDGVFFEETSSWPDFPDFRRYIINLLIINKLYEKVGFRGKQIWFLPVSNN